MANFNPLVKVAKRELLLAMLHMQESCCTLFCNEGGYYKKEFKYLFSLLTKERQVLLKLQIAQGSGECKTQKHNYPERNKSQH